MRSGQSDKVCRTSIIHWLQKSDAELCYSHISALTSIVINGYQFRSITNRKRGKASLSQTIPFTNQNIFLEQNIPNKFTLHLHPKRSMESYSFRPMIQWLYVHDFWSYLLNFREMFNDIWSYRPLLWIP